MNKLVEKANNLLKRTPALTLTSIDEDGYPRPIAMAILSADSIHEIWFVTPLDSKKIDHYRANPKAGITFYADGENITLVGDVEILTDIALKEKLWAAWVDNFYPDGPSNPNTALLRFVPNNGIFVFGQEFTRLSKEEIFE